MLLKMFLPMVFGALLWPNHLSINDGSEIKYLAEEGKIGITMPGDYKVSKDEGEATTTKAISEIDDVNYLFSWTLHSVSLDDPISLADVSLESFTEQVQGEIVTQDVYKYGDNEGVSATITLLEGEVKCFYRVVLIDQYQFQMVVVTTDTELNDTGKKFLDSFKYGK